MTSFLTDGMSDWQEVIRFDADLDRDADSGGIFINAVTVAILKLLLITRELVEKFL